MNAIVLLPGLHVCAALVRNPDGNLEGVECDQDSYSSMEVMYACVVGRPPTVTRELRFLLNGSIVDKVDCGSDFLVVYSHPIDERFIGVFRLEYWENGCRYWVRSFTMGTCPTAPVKREIPVVALVNLLRKFRT